MDRERWQQIDGLLSSALQLEPDQRKAFLETACAGDEDLRREVEDLLRAHDQAGDLLERPPLGKMELDLTRDQKTADLIGKQLGFYQVEELIGTGGMGRVYRARDTRLPRNVALKVLPEEYSEDVERVRRFKREAQAASALNHPNILTVYDVGESEGKLYLATEYIEGQTLRQRLVQGRLAVKEALDLGIQITGALAVAHRAGIVHRDVKPENIMVRPDGLAKVLDFGLARVTEPETETGEASGTVPTKSGIIMGTAGYMSPEQVQGAKLDERSDIFSFGAVLYEMLAGRRAFQRDSTSQTLAAIVDEDPTPVGEFIPDVPPELDRILRRCLCKDREHRFQHMDDVKVELEEVKEELKSGAAARAKLWWAAPLGGVFLLVVLGVASWLYLSRRPPEAPPQGPAEAFKIMPITSDGGEKRDPALSPNGELVAYAWAGPADDNWDIYVKGLGPDTRPLRLTEDPAHDRSPAWSPNGTQIAFVRDFEDGPAIYAVPWPSGQERRLVQLTGPTPLPGDSHLVTTVSWSPDGDWLAYAGRRSEDEPARIVRLALATLEEQPVTSPPSGTAGDFHPAFSPDGSQLAFVRSRGYADEDVWVQLVGGGEPWPLTFERFEGISSLVWTPDGGILLSTRNTVLRVKLADGEPRPVLGVGAGAGLPSIRGRRMVYAQWTHYPMDIWRVPGRKASHSDREPKRLIASSGMDAHPEYSPDGRRIAFSSTRSRGVLNIWVCNSDGTNPVQLTHQAKEAGTARWSPDGHRIVFDSVDEGDGNIYVIDAEGGIPRRLTQEPSQDYVPNWSHNGQWIYFTSDRSGENQIWKIPADGGAAVQVTQGGGAHPEESWNGSYLYYTKSFLRTGIWRVPVEGGAETEVFSGPIGGKNWALSSSGVYYFTRTVRGRRREYAILHLDFGSGQVTELSRKVGPIEFQSGLAASRDEHWLLHRENPLPTSELMLMENFR